MAESKTATPTIISKLSVKTVGTDPKEAIKQGKAVPLARFWGIAESTKFVVNRQTGDTNTAIIGTFRGMNLATGEVFESGVLYLPAGIHDQLSGPLLRQKESPDAQPIRFGVEVSATPASNPVGYTYTAKPLMRPQGVDPLAEMEAEVNLRALPKPDKKSAA